MRIYLRLLAVFLLLFAGNILYAEAQQEKRVTGTVTSEGEPLPGVSVQLKGASSGTITDIDGNYTITISGKKNLVISFIGYTTQVISDLSQKKIVLKEDAQQLD